MYKNQLTPSLTVSKDYRYKNFCARLVPRYRERDSILPETTHGFGDLDAIWQCHINRDTLNASINGICHNGVRHSDDFVIWPIVVGMNQVYNQLDNRTLQTRALGL